MDGIIIINKPKNCTSHDIVQKAKKIFGEKVGHTGTLDPMATGVLPLLIGKGTLCSKYLINHDKTYQVTLQLGKKTETADSEGEVIEEKKLPQESLEKPKIEKVLESFLGKQEQIPPMYSAIKINGKKLYEYARKGQKVEIPSRSIEIYKITLSNINIKSKQIAFEVSCSKGTYIRSLCEDIAAKLETVGYMLELKRIQVGEFSLDQSITLAELKEHQNEEEFIKEHFITIEKLFCDKQSICLEKRKLELFLNGVQLTQDLEDGIYRIYCQQKFIGIGTVKSKLLKRDIIL